MTHTAAPLTGSHQMGAHSLLEQMLPSKSGVRKCLSPTPSPLPSTQRVTERLRGWYRPLKRQSPMPEITSNLYNLVWPTSTTTKGSKGLVLLQSYSCSEPPVNQGLPIFPHFLEMLISSGWLVLPPEICRSNRPKTNANLRYLYTTSE